MSKQPIFDSEAQFFELLHQARNAKKMGAIAIGIFGSRVKGSHVLGKSDVDLMVVHPGASNYGNYRYQDHATHIVETPPVVEGDSSNSIALKKMRGETRWVWAKKVND